MNSLNSLVGAEFPVRVISLLTSLRVAIRSYSRKKRSPCGGFLSGCGLDRPGLYAVTHGNGSGCSRGDDGGGRAWVVSMRGWRTTPER